MGSGTWKMGEELTGEGQGQPGECCKHKEQQGHRQEDRRDAVLQPSRGDNAEKTLTSSRSRDTSYRGDCSSRVTRNH